LIKPQPGSGQCGQRDQCNGEKRLSNHDVSPFSVGLVEI
jgi:hypothetical protein